MAVEKALEYAAQTSIQGSQSQGSRKAERTNQKEKVTKSSDRRSAEMTADEMTDKAVQYDVSKRTNEVAAWYQEFLRKEQEEQLSIVEMTLEEEKQAAKEEEKDSIREALEKAEEAAKSLEIMLEKMREMQKKQREEKKKKKKLSYSCRRISNSISTAKTSTQASNALSSATTNLSMIRRKAASGKYEEKEIRLALQHANKMVRVARKKVDNLKREAQQQKRNMATENHKKQQNSMLHQIPVQQKAEKELQQLQAELKSREKMEKNRNRRVEDMELMQADMQYLRRRIDLLKNHGLTLSSQQQQTVDDMIAAAMGFVSVELKEQAVEASEGAAADTTSVESASVDTAVAAGGFETTV